MGSAYADFLAHEGVARLFEPTAVLQAMLDIERAVVLEQGHCGLVPMEQAERVAACCHIAPADASALVARAARAGSLAIPLVDHLRALVQAQAPSALKAVHWGLTSQDLVDTALSLQGRQALAFLDADLARLLRAILQLRNAHGDEPLLARTLLQPAGPTVLEARLLNWALPLQRCRLELAQRGMQALSLQLAGPIGTASVWGPQAVALRQAVARRLNLPLHPWVWQVQRDSVARLAAELGVLVGAVGKVATDVALMAQAEVAELTESAAEGRGGSSAMPHKRNPVGAMVALAALQRAPMRVAAVLGAMAQPMERAGGVWQAEGAELTELFVMAAAAVAAMADALESAQVHTARLVEHAHAFARQQGLPLDPPDALREERARLWQALAQSLDTAD